MDIKLVMCTARSATIEIVDGGIFYLKERYTMKINGVGSGVVDRTITSIYNLKPDTKYTITLYKEGTDEAVGKTEFRTAYEFVTLDVRDFGAKGDGVQDDTIYIQSAIMACPKDSRVLIPKGKYLITSLFLKSNISIEIEKDAELIADTNRYHYPIYPGLIESYDEEKEYNLGTWEGNPLKMFTGIITGVDVENVKLYGEGIINGNASRENWWHNEKVMVGAFRPRMLFLNRCKNIIVQGLNFHDSPAWVIHPYFSNNLKFYTLNIENPHDSPNTDGLDPESCKNVEIQGVRFSLGDDCIAVKSGKIYMGKKYKVASENIHVRQCLMENGHGAVTVGSEMAAGVKNLVVEECLFRHTDRGLRVKTRRGRGEDAVVDNIIFRNLIMDNVMTPFVVNSFYFCDPDGRTEYVQSREPYPVDDRTPAIKRLVFEDIECNECHVMAAFFYGLPEKKIEEIVMRNININYAKNPKEGVPAMLEGVGACCRKGIYANNVEKFILKNVNIEGQDGEKVELENIDVLEQEE